MPLQLPGSLHAVPCAHRSTFDAHAAPSFPVLWYAHKRINHPSAVRTNACCAQTTEKSKHYGLTFMLPEPFDLSKEGLVFQYEVKFGEGHTCGGAYIKLLSHKEGECASCAARGEGRMHSRRSCPKLLRLPAAGSGLRPSFANTRMLMHNTHCPI